ncbi:SWIM zinc finger family protein [Streptomyces sp. NPDC059002]|uniref:SWIM zinc finger family protein n=1 Tax=Streptomyces sp. NPDC059002 TaxID=3346690 RepID=UPI0036A6FCAF
MSETSRMGSGRVFPALPARPDPDVPFATSWWGNAWIRALEESALDQARLARGRNYAREGSVDTITVAPGRIVAYVHGSRARPYRAELRLRTLTPEDWARFLDAVAADPAHIAALLDKDMPRELVAAAHRAGVQLLPAGRELAPSCSCPDRGTPCKHAAALTYQTARLLDADPFVLFLMRGGEEADLLDELAHRSARESAREERERGRGPGGAGAEAGAGVAGQGGEADGWGRAAGAVDRGGEAGVWGRAAGGRDREAVGGGRGAGGRDREAVGRGREAVVRDYEAVGRGREAVVRDYEADGRGREVVVRDYEADGRGREADGRDRGVVVRDHPGHEVPAAGGEPDSSAPDFAHASAPPLPGTLARDVLASAYRPPLPAPPAPPSRPGEPPVLPSMTGAPDPAALEFLVTDTAVRAHAYLMTGADPFPVAMEPWRDAVRLAACHPGLTGRRTFSRQFAELARSVDRSPKDLARAAAAWRQGAEDGLATLESPWDPPAGPFDRARGALVAADLPRMTIHRNHLTNAEGTLQLRYGRDGRWYPYRNEPGGDDWWPEGDADVDPVGALAGVLED